MAALKAALAKVLDLFVLFGNTRNLSPTFRILAKAVPEPATKTEPDSVVTVPAPTICPLIWAVVKWWLFPEPKSVTVIGVPEIALSAEVATLM